MVATLSWPVRPPLQHVAQRDDPHRDHGGGGQGWQRAGRDMRAEHTGHYGVDHGNAGGEHPVNERAPQREPQIDQAVPQQCPAQCDRHTWAEIRPCRRG